MAYSVQQRSHEFGVRLALGARPASLLGMVISQGFRQVWMGLGIGLALSYAMARAMSAALFGLVPVEPLVLASLALLLTLVAVAASMVPAQRASRVDPIVALRYE